jgi:PAS domain S-box-containing protein
MGAVTTTKNDKRSNLHVRALMATTGEGLIAFDPSGMVRLMNEAASALLGRTREDGVGRPVEDLGVPELAEHVRRALARGSRAHAHACAFSVGDRYIGCRIGRFGGSEGPGVVATLRDDTELIEEQERWQAILSSTGDGLIFFTPDNCITYINPAACDMLGTPCRKLVGRVVTVEDLLGLPPREEVQPVPCYELRDCNRLECPARGSDDLRCWLVSGTPGVEGGPAAFSDKRVACATCDVYKRNAGAFDAMSGDGAIEITLGGPDQQRIVQTRTNPVLDAKGRYIGMVLTLHDVTAEREIAQMKNEFVSTVSHELRTPLTSIKGYVDLILDGDAGEVNEIQREFLTIVKENSDRLVALINDILDISRIESGRVVLKVEPIGMTEIIAGTVDSFKAVLDQSGRSITTKIPEHLPKVAGDRDRVGQVLMNLVSNAIKYSPEGGDVTITAKRNNDTIVVGVTDHGMGIDADDQKKLFTKFYRVDSALTREIGGTGLGLSICKTIIELLGGKIWVRSKAGEGSTFSFSLPVAPRELVRTPYVQGPAETGGKVLVVDRDPEIAALIETYLTKRGYDVVKAYTAAEALEVASREKPRVITLDVILDDADGFELLQRLKDRRETANIPVVVLSIVCDEGKSCRLGAADYLEKPIDQGRLLRIVDSLVGQIASPLALIVDDDRDIVKVLTRSMRSKGFAVAAAFNGLEALAAIKKKKPDVMLLDLKMPEMDGYQVIQQVKTNKDWSDIPIVVMTAHRIDHDRIDIVKMATTQLAKPVSPEEIAEQVEAFMIKRSEAAHEEAEVSEK